MNVSDEQLEIATKGLQAFTGGSAAFVQENAGTASAQLRPDGEAGSAEI
jgi:hypothetical protein